MTFKEFLKEYNLKLDSRQQKAAEQTEGAVLVLAVPGSGQNHGFGNPFRVYDKMQGHKPGKYPNRYIYKGRHRGYG